MAEKKRTVADHPAGRPARPVSSTRRLPTAAKPAAKKAPAARKSVPAKKAASPAKKSASPAKKAASPAKRAAAPDNDSLLVALEVWRSVVAALRQAKYDEIGPAYAKLSTLLVQQRTGDLLADAPQRAEWAELSATARQAVELLEPVMTAARHLATLPHRVDLDSDTNGASRDAVQAGTGRPADRRESAK